MKQIGRIQTGRRLASFALCLAMLLTLLPAAMPAKAETEALSTDDYTFETDENGNYLVPNIAAWNAIADLVQSGNNLQGKIFLMTADIGSEEEPVRRPIGIQTGPGHDSRKRFAGIFDGGETMHTLYVDIDTDDEACAAYYANFNGYCAPFAYTQNATIRNLHVEGTLTTTGQFASGLVGQSGPDNNANLGRITIENCRVSVDFVGNTDPKKNGNHGTFVSIAEGRATITNCWFDGSLTGTNYYYSGGFIGLNKANASLNNCFFNPSVIDIENNNIGGSREFVHNNNGGGCGLTSCYYTKSFSKPEDAQGVKVWAGADVPAGSVTEEVTAADGETYFIIKHNADWLAVQNALAEGENNETVTLTKDITAGTEDTALVVPGGRLVTLDLAGYTINRGLDIVAAQAYGYVIKIEGGGTLILVDESQEKTGLITGGHNTENGGGIYNAGNLMTAGVTISGNYAKNGGGIYNDTNALAEVQDTVVSGNHSTRGGGLYNNGGTLNAGGCEIYNNTATAGDTGSGIYLKAGSVWVTNTNITGNTSTNSSACGLGVYVENGAQLKVSSKVKITGNKTGTRAANVFLKSNAVIYLKDNEALDTASVIGVSKGTGGSALTGGVITSGLNALGETPSGDLASFVSDSAVYGVRGNADGEAALMFLYDVSIGSPIQNGSVIAETAKAAEGDEVVLTVIPASGYQLDTLTVTPASGEAITIQGSVEQDDYSFTMPAANVTVTASFVERQTMFGKHRLHLTDQIGVQFQIIPLEGYDDLSIDFSVSDGRTQTMSLADAEDENGTYWFTCSINALELADEITATLKNGDTVIGTNTYSAMQYIESARNIYRSNEKLMAIVDALQDYGHYMQQTTWKDEFASHEPIAAYNTLGDADMAAAEAGTEALKVDRTNVSSDAVSDVRISLVLNAQTKIRVYFKLADNVTLTSGRPATEQIGDDLYYRLTTASIGPKNLGKWYDVTLGTSAGDAKVSVTAMSYVYAVLASSQATRAQKLAMTAYYNYYKAADAYNVD